MKLTELIRREFSEVPRPHPAKIAARSSNPVSLEALDVEAFFGQFTWPEMSWEKLMNYEGDKTACLYFMSPEAFLYFFPSYMTMTLDDVSMKTGLLYPVVSITYPQEMGSTFFELIQSKYDASQKRCIGYFLLEINDRYMKSCVPDPDGNPLVEPDELQPEEAAFRYWLTDPGEISRPTG